MDFEQTKADYDQYVMHSYGRFDVALVSGKNATATDVEGKTYIDFGAGIGVNALGYADEGWIKAVSGQAAKHHRLSGKFLPRPYGDHPFRHRTGCVPQLFFPL